MRFLYRFLLAYSWCVFITSNAFSAKMYYSSIGEGSKKDFIVKKGDPPKAYSIESFQCKFEHRVFKDLGKDALLVNCKDKISGSKFTTQTNCENDLTYLSFTLYGKDTNEKDAKMVYFWCKGPPI